MAKQPIGFRLDDDNIDEPILEEAVAPETIDLNNGLVEVVNYLLDILNYYKKSIKGVTVDVNTSGKYSVKIKY